MNITTKVQKYCFWSNAGSFDNIVIVYYFNNKRQLLYICILSQP